MHRRHGRRVRDGSAGQRDSSSAADDSASRLAEYFRAHAGVSRRAEVGRRKVLTVFPVNHGTAIDAHQGAVLLFEADHGRLLAILDATTVTAIRTAAVSALATRLLARADADEVAIIGAGTQGRMHLDAMTVVRPVRHVRIWSRTTEHAEASRQHARDRFDLRADVCSTPAQAVERLDCLHDDRVADACPRGEVAAAGYPCNAVGACFPTTRELDTEAVRRARLYVDRRESALAEPGDILFPLKEGAIGPDHIVAEIGELLLPGGDSLGRRSDDEITIFKSLGLAVEDLAAAHHVYRKAAKRSGRGRGSCSAAHTSDGGRRRSITICPRETGGAHVTTPTLAPSTLEEVIAARTRIAGDRPSDAAGPAVRRHAG